MNTKLASTDECVFATSTITNDSHNIFTTMTSVDHVSYDTSRLTIVVSPVGKVTMLIAKPLNEIELKPSSDSSNECVTSPIELYMVRAYAGRDDELQETLRDIIRRNPFIRRDSVGVLMQGVIEEYPYDPKFVRIRCKGCTEIYPNKPFNLTLLLRNIHDDYVFNVKKGILQKCMTLFQ